MKKVLILLVGLVTCVFLSACSSTDKEGYFGTYTFENVTYLSALSSSTIGYENEKMAGTKYIIEADLFKIDSKDSTVEISSPNYVKGEVHKGAKGDSVLSYDAYTLLGKELKYQYTITIYDKDKNKTHLRLYVSSDCLWIASYADNTAKGSEIIMSIYKLSK